MDKEEYKSWTNYFLKQPLINAQKLFFEMINLGSCLKRASSPAINYHIETSFNSEEKLRSIKIAHIFRYPIFLDEKNSQNFIKDNLLLNFVKKINKNQRCDFNLSAFKFILSIPLSSGNKNDVIVFYADFNLYHNNFSKISVHLNPSKNALPMAINQFLQFLKIKNNISIPLSVFLKNLDFLGFDFYPTSECQLKIYRREKKLPENLSKKNKKLFYQIISQINKINLNERTILLMNKFNNKGVSLVRPDVYIYCENLIHYKNLFRFDFLDSYKDFLKEIKPYVNLLTLTWIILKNKKLELYFV